MAVQANAPGGPTTEVGVGASSGRQTSAGAIWSEMRRVPVIPLLVLVIFLLIPAVFANIIAPHDPIENHLESTELPPFWVGSQTVSNEIVQRANREAPEASINNVPHLLASGAATLEDANGNGQPDLGEYVTQSAKGGSWEYPLGTDKLGRDVFSRLLHGARVSLMVSCLAILVGGFLGTTLGMVAAFRGGIVDSLVMRIVDIKLAFPSILLALTCILRQRKRSAHGMRQTGVDRVTIGRTKARVAASIPREPERLPGPAEPASCK